LNVFGACLGDRLQHHCTLQRNQPEFRCLLLLLLLLLFVAAAAAAAGYWPKVCSKSVQQQPQLLPTACSALSLHRSALPSGSRAVQFAQQNSQMILVSI
jgi:hypothetical protein